MEIRDLAIAAGSAAYGAGIGNDGGQLRVTRCVLIGNRATSAGGGIANTGTVWLVDSQLIDNTAVAAAGIANGGTLEVTRSTLRNNIADTYGGGLFDYLGAVGIGYATFCGNQAVQGGGIYNWFPGGVMVLPSSSSALAATPRTAGQRADSTPMKIINTIFDQSTGGSIYGAAGNTESHGYNLFSDTPMVDLQRSDLPNRDPRLGPLADNLGPTWTHALSAGSPAIDAGMASQEFTTDQRGAPRPQGGEPDIGAFEYQPPPPPGGLDPKFQFSGKVITDFGPGYGGAAYDVAIQPDGKTVAVGNHVSADDLRGSDFALARYWPDGRLDTSFGTGGLVTVDLGSTDDCAYSVAILPGGKILVAGRTEMTWTSRSRVAIACFEADGDLDLSFGPKQTGFVILDFSPRFDAFDAYEGGMAIQPSDGKILVTGL